MKIRDFVFKDSYGADIFVYNYLPEKEKVQGVVQIAHGMAEHAARYERFAKALTDEGYVVYANDHRGHGRTAGSVEKVGYMGEDGFNRAIGDLKELNDIIKKQNPGLPVYLFGHSMGSIMSQRYIELYGDSINGVILSGTTGKQGIILKLGEILGIREVKKNGRESRSDFLNNLTFGSYNNAFRPNRTKFDWLSRDEAEVDKYINDPFCGGVFSAGFFLDMTRNLLILHKEGEMKKIPKGLPIYVMNGEKDPLGKNCRTVKWLLDKFRNLGIKDVSHKFYRDGRHEMLNEINKGEVTNDIINWIKLH